MTDKVVHTHSLGPERVEDAMEMAKIASGLDEREFFQGQEFLPTLTLLLR